MASSVAATTMSGTAVSVRSVSSFSSSSTFGSPLVNAAPVMRPAASRRNVLIARAALPEEQSGRSGRREMMASLMAAGAAFATVGQSIAASGPGTPGAQRTSEKADDLLKAADKLTTDESPARFGPGRIASGDESSQIAQKGGSGAVEGLQGGASSAAEGAKSTYEEAKSRFESVLGKKTGDLSDASIAFDDLKSQAGSAADKTKSKVDSDISTTKGKTDSLVGDAQSKVEGSGSDGKNLIGGLLDKIQDSTKGSLPQ